MPFPDVGYLSVYMLPLDQILAGAVCVSENCFLIFSVMSLSASQGVAEVSLDLLSRSALLVHSLGPLCAVKALLQSSSLGPLSSVAACSSTILSWFFLVLFK